MGYQLGVDIGTTTVKACLLYDNKVTSSVQLPHHGYEKTTARNSNRHPTSQLREQDPYLLIHTVQQCLQKLDIPSKARSIGIETFSATGQMHGVVMWKEKEKNKYIECRDEINPPGSENVSVEVQIENNSRNSGQIASSPNFENYLVGGEMEKSDVRDLTWLFSEKVECYSNLITWEDQRCSDEFLKSIPSSLFGSLSTGYGSATLLWLQLHDTPYLHTFTLCGTIMDFLVWLLTHEKYVTITSHNANSWGYFDNSGFCWEKEKFSSMNFDVSILPIIIQTNQEVGVSVISCYGLTKNVTKIYGGLGDMQCSIRSPQPSIHEAVLNIGTSSQISFVLKKATSEITFDELRMNHPGLNIVPYQHDDVIVTAASLTGGNVIANFATMLQDWMEEFGCEKIPSTDSMLQTLQARAEAYNPVTSSQLPTICPRVYGERYARDSHGTVSNITSSNMCLGSVSCALYRGIVENLQVMMPKELLISYNIARIVVTGGAITKNQLLQSMVSDIFELPVRISQHDDAAYGAILFLEEGKL